MSAATRPAIASFFIGQGYPRAIRPRVIALLLLCAPVLLGGCGGGDDDGGRSPAAKGPRTEPIVEAYLRYTLAGEPAEACRTMVAGLAATFAGEDPSGDPSGPAGRACRGQLTRAREQHSFAAGPAYPSKSDVQAIAVKGRFAAMRVANAGPRHATRIGLLVNTRAGWLVYGEKQGDVVLAYRRQVPPEFDALVKRVED